MFSKLNKLLVAADKGARFVMKLMMNPVVSFGALTAAVIYKCVK